MPADSSTFYDSSYFLGSSPHRGAFSLVDLGPKFIDRTESVVAYYNLLSAGPGKIVEIGCGTTPFYRLMRQQPALNHIDVTCTDITDEGIKLLPESDRPPFYKAGADDLPFDDATMSRTIMWDVLEHIENPEQALKEAHRILQPEGFLHIVCPNPESWQRNDQDPEKDVYRRDSSHIFPPIVTAAFLQDALYGTGFVFELYTRGFPGIDPQIQTGISAMRPATVDATGTHLVAFARKA